MPPPSKKPRRKIPQKRLLAAAFACLGVLLVGIVMWMVLHHAPAPAGGDGFQPGAEWSGVFRFRPPDQDYNGDVVLRIEQRDGERFTGMYSTERSQYIWRVRGTVQDGNVAWEFIEVIKEANHVEVVANATVEGTYEGSKMQVTFHHHLKQSTADMTLWLQK